MSDPLTERQVLALEARRLAEDLYDFARKHPSSTVQGSDEDWKAYTARAIAEGERMQTEARELFAGRVGWIVERAKGLGASDRKLELEADGYWVNALSTKALADALGVLSHRLLGG